MTSLNRSSESKSDLISSHTMGSVYYAGPNASTIIPVDSTAFFPPSNISSISTSQRETSFYDGQPRPHFPDPKSEPSWSWGSTVCSVVSTLCCVSICGFFGLLCSILSYVDHRSGDYRASQRKRYWGMSCAVVGCLITLLGVLAVVLIFVVFRDELKDVLSSVGYSPDAHFPWKMMHIICWTVYCSELIYSKLSFLFTGTLSYFFMNICVASRHDNNIQKCTSSCGKYWLCIVICHVYSCNTEE